MYSSICGGVQSFSGSVTLKNASVDLVSNGPGASMEAKVVARINGGVSCKVGRLRDGVVMMELGIGEIANAREFIAESLQALIRRRMIFLELSQ